MRATVVLVLFLAVSCSLATAKTNDNIISMVLDALDTSVNPCDDFYQYACGGWMKANPLPADKSSYSRTFTVIADSNQQVLKNIASDPSSGIVNIFYEACMNTAAIEKAGNKPLRTLLPLIDRVVDNSTMMLTIGQLHSIGVKALFDFGVDLDAENPKTYIAQFFQGGLSLPDRSLYLDNDPETAGIRSQYLDHIVRMFKLSGYSTSDSQGQALYALDVETQIANASLPNDQLIDPFATYNKLNISGLNKISPVLPWSKFMVGVGRPDATQANVQVPDFFAALSTIATRMSVSAMQAYLRWFVIHKNAPYLSQAFVNEDFAFFGKIIDGKKQLPERWKACVDRLDKSLGDLTGKYYAQQMFSSASKQAASDLIQYIEQAMSADIQTLSWMDETTREGADDKMAKLSNLVGYPAHPSNYTGLSLGYTEYFQNSLTAINYNFIAQVKKLEGPIDPDEWLMTASTVNAYYEPTRNQMVFPAGILQPPFFDLSYPWAINFGGIGVVMGHENTHGFDNQGSKFNGDGKLVDWWAPETAALFQQKVDCVIAQYSSFEVLPGVYVNGNLTQGENIADMGGVKLSLNAYLAHINEKPDAPSAVPGFTNIQLYFLAFGQSWCSNYTDEYLKNLVKTNPHSPHKFRVIGALQNTPEFATAYKCPVGSYMNPPNRCEVW